MNPFKSVHQFVKMIGGDDEGPMLLGHIVCWVAIYFVLWFLLGYLGPYLILLSFPLIVIPFVWGLWLWIPFDEEWAARCFEGAVNNRLNILWVMIPLFLCGFVFFVGIPSYYEGFIPRMMREEAFQVFFFKAIKHWWVFFNYINPFASDDIPYRFYLPVLYPWRVQVVFSIGSLLGIPIVMLRQYCRALTKKEEREEVLKASRLKEEVEHENQARQQELERQREEEKRIELEKVKRRKDLEKEASDPDPWDSGFLG